MYSNRIVCLGDNSEIAHYKLMMSNEDLSNIKSGTGTINTNFVSATAPSCSKGYSSVQNYSGMVRFKYILICLY